MLWRQARWKGAGRAQHVRVRDDRRAPAPSPAPSPAAFLRECGPFLLSSSARSGNSDTGARAPPWPSRRAARTVRVPLPSRSAIAPR
jgi:hypothetical protein